MPDLHKYGKHYSAMKTCTKCLQSKSFEEFHKFCRAKDGRMSWCKICAAEQKKEYIAANQEAVSERKRRYRLANKPRFNKQRSDRYKSDIEFRLAAVLRNRLRKVLGRTTRTASHIRDLGCSVIELKQWLEGQFQPGMTWDNHGEWHIDHIKPLSGFNLANRDELLKACHYTNLQPLWALENISKNGPRRSSHDTRGIEG